MNISRKDADPPPAPPCKLAGRGVERSETGWVQTFYTRIRFSV